MVTIHFSLSPNHFKGQSFPLKKSLSCCVKCSIKFIVKCVFVCVCVSKDLDAEAAVSCESENTKRSSLILITFSSLLHIFSTLYNDHMERYHAFMQPKICISVCSLLT